jgi:hypothetical protein
LALYEDELEEHQALRILALQTIDEVTETKLAILEGNKKVPLFINNAISFLKKKYVTDEKNYSKYLYKK